MKYTPPYLLSFQNIDEYIKALGCENTDISNIRKLNDKKLPLVVSAENLAVLFGYSLPFVKYILKSPTKFYRKFLIKKGKKNREIQSPLIALKVIQKWFGYHLDKCFTHSEYSFGFIKGKNIFEGAYKHCKAKWVYCLDIEDFFGSISKDMIISNMKKLGYNEKSGELIAKLCSYNEGLAQGSPASPTISNIVFKQTDESIYKVASEYNITYTRYADDLAFSSKKDISENKLAKFQEKLKAVITQNNWKLNSTKERYSKLPKRLKVYGLLVDFEYPRFTKGYRNKLRAYNYILEKNKNLKNKEVLTGHLAYKQALEKFIVSLNTKSRI